MIRSNCLPLAAALVLGACGSSPIKEQPVSFDFLSSPVRETAHRGNDDLVSAGLELAGLRGAPSTFSDPASPTAAELRRRAIQTAWKGIADFGVLGRFGDLYGSVAVVPGREFQAFATVPGARSPHRVLVQIPDAFDARKRCLIVTASPGSRGIYGGIALAGAWGLGHGCAVAYTDKGAGPGYFDTTDESGVALDGTRRARGTEALEFSADNYNGESGIAIKHAHSGDNPEAHWGQQVLQATTFGLAMLDRAYPEAAPFLAHNTKIIAVGISNGGGAVLQAAGVDDLNWLAGVVAIEPNIYAPRIAGASHARPLYDYASDAAQLLPCALLDARFDQARAELPGAPSTTWNVRCATLRTAGLIHGDDMAAQAASALQQLRSAGWNDAALTSATVITALDLWRTLGVTYASAYSRSSVGDTPCGFRFALLDASGKRRVATAAERSAWWADASGIPPGNGVFITETKPGPGEDSAWSGIACLRQLWTGNGAAALRLRDGVQATQARLPRKDLPLFIVHGAEDGLIPAAFSSDAYVAWLRASKQDAAYWSLAHVQHFDAFLARPGFGDRYVPILPYAYAALDRMYQHIYNAAPLDTNGTPTSRPRGAQPLDAGHLGLTP